jgi:YVTN family beta-propeller protein
LSTRGRYLRIAAAVLIVGACNSSTTESTPVSQLVVQPDSIVLRVGDSVRLTVNALDSQGHLLTGIAISFSSSDTSIVTVSNTGLALAKKKGSAHVVVSGGGVAAQVPTTISALAAVIDSVPVPDRPFEIASKGSNTYVATIGEVVRFNEATLAVGASVHPTMSLPVRVTVNAAGDRLYVGDIGAAKVWVVNVATDSVIDSIATTGQPAPLAIIGGALFVATDANKLYKVNVGTKLATDSIPLSATAHHMLAHPNDTTLYVATRDGGTVMEVNARTMTVTRTFTIGGRTQAMALSPDRHTLYVANETESYIFVVALSSGTVTDSIPLVGGAFGLAISSDGRNLYAGLPAAGKVQVINVATHSVSTTLFVSGTPREILFDATHQHVLVPNEGGWVDVLSP